MSMIEQAAVEFLDRAQRDAAAIDQLTSVSGWALTVGQAYHIQAGVFQRRLARGERMLGLKMGFTSRAKMIQMGVSEMIWGRLSDGMLVEDGGDFTVDHAIHPRVEPEVAFLLRRRLAGRVSVAEALDAVEATAPALEIVNSRYRNFKFSLVDVVADNCSACGFAIGAWNAVPKDLSNLGMVLSFDGKPVRIGSSAAILGHPARSLVAAARLAGEAGLALERGMILLAGGATEAEPLAAGRHVRVEVEGLGTAEFYAR